LELAGHHLLELGHRRIGLLGTNDKVPVEIARLIACVAPWKHATLIQRSPS
jgi:DNA-binding LacI/PurR family transcriptional regulator